MVNDQGSTESRPTGLIQGLVEPLFLRDDENTLKTSTSVRQVIHRDENPTNPCFPSTFDYDGDTMESVMTLQEMEARFDSEWILVGDPETTNALEVIRGAVLHHSKDRDEVYRSAVKLRPKRSAILFTGQMPADTAIVL